MADIYSTEPLTSGKVCLITSLGDFDVELWAREAPITCKSFLQHCLDGYFDGMIFHRVIRDFMAQTGDPTGTGEGGEGAYEKTFKDEFHSRLRFNRRGLLGMANAGKNDNGSQFFITLDAANDLNKKHTLFGKITGPTVFNMMRLNELEPSEQHPERPKRPPFIKRTEVLNLGIFKDLVQRELKVKYNHETGRRENVAEAAQKKADDKKKKFKSKAVKNFGLLSFGDEAESDEEHEMQSRHIIKKKSIYETPVEVQPEKVEVEEKAPEPVVEVKVVEPPKPVEVKKSKKVLKAERKQEKKEKRKQANAMLQALHEEQTTYRAQSDQIAKKGRKREDVTMRLLTGFTSKLKEETLKNKHNPPKSHDLDEQLPENDSSSEDDPSGLWGHTFVAIDPEQERANKRAKQEAIRLGTDGKGAKDAATGITEESYALHDPRNTINKRRREAEGKRSLKKAKLMSKQKLASKFGSAI